MTSSDRYLRPPDARPLVGTTELLRALVSKELKVKYKRSALGFLWSLITPIALAGIYLFVFVYVYKVPKPDFILFLLSGLLPWQYFNMSVMAATSSFVENGALIRKAYFPRHLLPLSIVLANLINFLIGLGVLLIVVAIAGKPFWSQAHWLVGAVALETLLLAGFTLILSVGNIYFRDIQQLISILMLVFFFATPVVYEFSQLDGLPSWLRGIVMANPLTAVMEMYRAALFNMAPPRLHLVFLGFMEMIAVLALGAWLFRRLGPHMAKEV